MQTHRAASSYLVTLWTYGLRPTFAEPRNAALFCRSLQTLRQRLGFKVHAYVVLPERVRLILGAEDPDARWLRDALQRLKSRFAREVNSRSGRLGLVWQDADQRLPLRDEADIARRAEILHRNPVLEGLVEHPRLWRYSSFRAWSGEGPAPVPVDVPGVRRGGSRAGAPVSG
jgi:REP element-mobilizing transposase RayT